MKIEINIRLEKGEIYIEKKMRIVGTARDGKHRERWEKRE